MVRVRARLARAVGVAALLTVPAFAGPTLRAPLPFSHAEHAGSFRRADVWCTDCHPMGPAVQGGDVATGPLAAATATCHGCHVNDAVPRAGRAPSACATCHPVADEIVPATHGIGWIDGHGAVASRLRTDCSDCHARTECLDCHEGRGAGVRSPHGPGFRTLHGVEARLDPVSCASCHAADTCATCHATGGAPW